MHNLRSANQGRQAALLNARDAREMVVIAVSGSYLRVLATQALVASQEAQVKYAEVSYKQARDQMEAGTKAQIDANRSLVELWSQQQRLTSDKTQLTKEQMSLARVIGLPLDRQLVLAETLPTQRGRSFGARRTFFVAFYHPPARPLRFATTLAGRHSYAAVGLLETLQNRLNDPSLTASPHQPSDASDTTIIFNDVVRVVTAPLISP